MRKIKVLQDYPPIHEIFHQFREKTDVVFLDSSLRNELGEYSVIGLYPYLKLVKGENFTVNGQVQEGSFEQFMREYLKVQEEVNETELPIVSGAIGYFSYEYGKEAEGLASRHEKEQEVPDSIFCFYDVFVIEDHRKKELSLIANGHTDSAEQLLDRVFGKIMRSEDIELPEQYETQVQADADRETYMSSIGKMVNHIYEGDIYIANLTQQLRIKSGRKPYDVFRKLRQINPSPFGGYFNYEEFRAVSASPERFLKMADSHVVTRPIKGTRKRGASAEEDAALSQELLESEKDRSELLMIVDLERNDLNKVCRPGSVKVTELFAIEKYATVFHLVAAVEGDLKEGLGVMDLIKAAFPGGSITGAPKLRAMEVIDDLEKSPRGLYTGCMGYISLDGNCDFNIAIRTAVHYNKGYHLGVGGGITCESDPVSEYEEILQKAKAIMEAMK